MCSTHYRQTLKGEELTPIRSYAQRKDALCIGPDCTNPVSAKGLCSTHYSQAYKGKELAPIGSYMPRKDALCLGPDCSRPVVARGLCASHYCQSRKGKPLTPIGSTVRKAKPAATKRPAIIERETTEAAKVERRYISALERASLDRDKPFKRKRVAKRPSTDRNPYAASEIRTPNGMLGYIRAYRTHELGASLLVKIGDNQSWLSIVGENAPIDSDNSAALMSNGLIRH